MTNEKAIALVNDAFSGYYCDWEGTFTETEKDELAEANRMAIAALDKDTNVPSKSALDHIHNVVAENEYKRGYEQGKADAIPMDWIRDYLVWLKGIGGYGLSDARAIQSMIIKWKMDNQHSGCGPDYCELGENG